MYLYLIAAYAVISAITAFLYMRDKRKAKKQRWRTKEATLLSFGFFGGAIGGLIGMNVFRHKTKHWYFWVVNVLGLIWQVALVVVLFVLGI